MFKANGKVGMLRNRRPLVFSAPAIEIRSFSFSITSDLRLELFYLNFYPSGL